MVFLCIYSLCFTDSANIFQLHLVLFSSQSQTSICLDILSELFLNTHMLIRFVFFVINISTFEWLAPVRSC